MFKLLLKPVILLKIIHFKLHIQNKKLTLLVIALRHILTLIIIFTARFYLYTSFSLSF